jgi:hypothetical protein
MVERTVRDARQRVELQRDALPIADDAVTVSGIAACGYMAVQCRVANCALVSGAGIVAAGHAFSSARWRPSNQFAAERTRCPP